MKKDGMPRFTVTEHDAGLMMGAARTADNGNLYWRISQFMMPATRWRQVRFPAKITTDRPSCRSRRDVLDLLLHLEPGAAADQFRARALQQGPTVHANVDENWVPIRNRDNDYLIDREEQKYHTYTGIKGVSEQDACIQDSQGIIADRTRELLGPTDIGIVRFRASILESAKGAGEGQEPRAASKSES